MFLKGDEASFRQWCATHERDYCAKYASAGAGATTTRLATFQSRMGVWMKNHATVTAHNARADAGKEVGVCVVGIIHKMVVLIVYWNWVAAVFFLGFFGAVRAARA